ncbi:MAG: glycosyltransferase family 39 protein [Nitrospirota bacterium]|nr:glycosyltransferase family 39 protein [Nitrospirota bacterium]
MNLPDIDTALFFFVNQNLHNPFFDRVMPFVTSQPFLVFLPFMLLLWLKEKPRVLPVMIAGLFAIAFADAGGHLLKDIVMRQRPCNALDNVHLLVGCGKSYSMPSNHAANAFAFAMTAWFLLRNRLGLVFVAVAALIGISRVFVGVHYPFDVAAGALVGTAAAYGAVYLYRWSEKIVIERSYEQALFLALAMLSIFRIYYIMTGPFDLSADEAHYWEWSRRPDWSYYSKGPVIAWLISIGTFFFGNTVLGIRAFAVLLSALSSILLFRLGKELYDERTGLAAALLLQVVPLFSVFGMLLTIDSPFIFFWILSLYLFHRILRQELSTAGERASSLLWILLGISTGLGLLTKFTMAFFLFSAGLYCLFEKDARRLLKTPGPYLGFLISMLVFSPAIFWNASSGWVTLKHTAGQAHLREGLVLSVWSFGEFLGSQFGVVTPLLFVMIIFAILKLRRTKEGAFLFWFFLPTIAFFLAKSIQGKVQANWAMTGYISGLVAFSALYVSRWDSLKKSLRLTVICAISLAMLVTLYAHIPSILKLPDKFDPSRKLAGWKELGEEVSVLYQDISAKGPVFVFSDKYQVASELAFYMKGHPVTYCVNLGRRMNQYDLWPGFENLKGQNAIFVRTGEKVNVPEEVASAFSSCDHRVIEVKTRKKKILQYSVSTCYDFKSFASQQPETF